MRLPAVGTAALAVLATAVVGVPAASAATRPTVPIHVSATHHVVAPATLHPGLVHLDNTGTHAIYVYKRKSSGPATLVQDLNSPTTTGLLRHFVQIDIVNGKTDVYLRLTRGTYYLIDAGRTHWTRSVVRTMHVSGTWINAIAPSANRLTVSTHDHISAPSSLPRNGYLRVINNNATRAEEVAIYRIGSGTSDHALAAFVAHPTLHKFSNLDITRFVEVALVGPRLGAYTHWHASSGRYLVVNFSFPLNGTTGFGVGHVREARVH